MLNALVLGFALVNFTADLGGNNVYPHMQNVFLQSSWHQSYYDYNTDYLYDLQCNFNVSLSLYFNDTSDRRLIYNSYELDSYVYVYDDSGDLLDTYHNDSYLNYSVTADTSASINDFVLTPRSTPNGFAYYLSYSSVDIGYFFIPDMVYNIDLFVPINFNSEEFGRILLLVQNSIIKSDSYNTGVEDGYNSGYENGVNTGYTSGYADGYREGASQDATAVAIFSGIISVGLIPINFFLACLNFEVFGINIGAFVSALLTVAIVVIITRMIVSGGNGGEK